MKSKKYLSIAFIGAVIGCMITYMSLPFFVPGIDNFLLPQSSENGNVTINVTGNTDNIYKAIIKKAMPSVVGITTVSSPLSFFDGGEITQGVGTGVIVESKGYILTNSHVVDDGAASHVTVMFNDGTSTKAEIIWNDKSIDLAIIKVDKQGLAVAELGDSDTVEVGDISVAIGNPLGLEFQRTVTEGIISGMDRTISVQNTDGSVATMEHLLQTSAAINPGNSGGPLLNQKGQVIGINSAKAGEGEGLGFAIPINLAKPIVDQFIETGSFQKVVLGIQVVDVETYQQMMNVDFGIDKGVIVIKVEENSIAQKNGIIVNDVITQMDTQKIDNNQDLLRYLYQVKSGDKIPSKIWRNGKTVEIDIQF